jgi:hypothetical protein
MQTSWVTMFFVFQSMFSLLDDIGCAAMQLAPMNARISPRTSLRTMFEDEKPDDKGLQSEGMVQRV